MNADKYKSGKHGAARLPVSRSFIPVVCLLLSVFWLLSSTALAATFTNNASIKADDSSNSLTATGGVFSASCWFRISIPSSLTLTTNMLILMDRSDGNESANYSYLIRYNAANGNIEFITKGNLNTYTRTLIAQPYLERWYHVAVTRNGGVFNVFVDGQRQQPFDVVSIVGNTTGNGLAIGGVNGDSRLFYGEIIEAAIYQRAFDQSEIRAAMFSDQRTNSLITGYYKLGYSTNASDNLRNFVSTPPPGTQLATKLGTGTINFEETDRDGEQSLFDSRRNQGQEAIASLSGGFSWQQTVFAMPTPGIALDFRIGYSSAIPTTPPGDGNDDPFLKRTLSAGWRHTFDTRVVVENNTFDARLITWDGSVEAWTRTNLTEPFRIRHKEYRGELAFDIFSGDVYWTNADRAVYRFYSLYGDANLVGRLREIYDFNGNKVQVSWNSAQRWVSTVTDSANGAYQFNYDEARSLLTNITFGSWRVNFTYDAITNRLISKSLTNTSGAYSAVNTTWQFQYNTNGLLASILDPRNNTNTLVQYDQYGRQTNQLDALSRATATRYGVPGKRQITRIDPGTNSWIETYDRKGHILSQQDPLNNVTSYAYDTNGNRISIAEPLGWTTSFGYDSRANVVAHTNALGEITRWAFHPFFNKAVQEINALGWTNFYAYDAGGNLTNHSDALGSLVRYTYSTNGLVLTSTDANGNTSQFAYDTNGFLISRTDPANNTWQFTVNDVGWKLAEINPFNDATTFAYDLNGNVVQTTDPLNRTFTRQHDANGNLLAQSDGKNQFTRHAYDAANQRIATTNRVGNVWQFTYNSRGKPDRSTDPLGNTATNFYDSANRLIAVSDPLGNSITNQYDANGNSIALFDVLGQRWSKTFDRLNRVITESDPLGDTKTTTYDPAGRIAQITTPNGYPSTHTYDGRGRLTKWVDAENFQWLYAYDGNANITNITDALNGHYVMTYSNRNERILESNQDNFEWQYTYDQLLRLKTQRDPNLTLRTRNYDSASRVTSHTLSTGREDTYTYDDNDNPRVIVRRVNGVAQSTTSLTYDALDRVTRVVDPHSQSVDYGFDALSRVVSVTYPGNRTLTNRYDVLSRLTNQVDWAARSMSYNYDKAGRLIRRAYPNGVVQTNTFDSAGRLTGLSHSPSTINSNSINVALTYAYDRNGNKVGNTERGTLAWPMPTLTDEASQFTPAGRLVDRSVQNTTSNQLSTINYSYDSSGNMTNAAGGGQSWRLTYDEDNRTTSLYWDWGMATQLITNRYDALGRRIARKVDGNPETRYVLDLSGGMERILCDTTSSGQITAYYIHGLDLSYRVDASNNIICYHADAQANIIAVTDGDGTNVAQYAYTPYGRSLGSTNSQLLSANSYLFVGSQGVMEELPGLYFMRARYYSADAGVFLSTDPVKKIGPGWKSQAYNFSFQNPLTFTDAKGETPAHLRAFFIGAVEGVLQAGAEEVVKTLGPGIAESVGGSAEVTQDVLAIGYAAKDVWDTSTGGAAALADPSGIVFAKFAGKKAGGLIFSGSKWLTTSVGNAGAAIGDQLNAALFGQGKSGSGSSVLYSSTAGTTPMANLKSTQTSISSKTTVAVSIASAASGGSTKPAGSTSNGGGSGASGGGSTSSGGGGGSTTYTVKAGDTLGNIGAKFGSTATAIGNASGIKNLNLIHPGQKLTIPRR